MRDTLERITDDPEKAAIHIALAVLYERVRSLPSADREDLYELANVFATAETEEDRDSAVVAMCEIIEKQPAGGVSRMDLSEEPHPELDDWLEHISKRIRDARQEADLTQDQLAELAGLPQSHISRLETGKHSPSRMTLEKIAEATGQPLSFFDPSA